MSARYQPREKPFLNDPDAYPEFSLLVKRERINHAIHFGLHRHRTAALLVLVAASTAASGGEMPKFWVAGGGGGGDSSSSSSSAAEWAAYLSKGINSALIEKHFEGLVSALGCMLVSCLTALLAYPIYLVASPSAGQDPAAPPPPCRSNLAARIVAAAAPSAAVWVLAARAAGLFRWGIASGLCVGLFCASLALKSISFVQQACPCWPPPPPPPPASSSPDAPDRAAAAGGGSCQAAATTARRGKSANGPRTRSRGGEGGGGEEEAGVGVGDDPSPQRQGRTRHRDSPSAPGTPSRGSSGGTPVPVPPLLTFAEFAFFLLLAPSLVCEPRLLASSARRPRRIAAAASEFFHAGLTYLAVHAACSAFFAPIMRVLAAALHHGWADEDAWADLHRIDGSGWWLLDDGGGSGGCGADGGGGVCGEAGSGVEGFGQQVRGPTVAVAACLGMFVFTPLMHFLMFYAFFHAVCLGCAELWGYPDRNIYGPWWLVMDDIRDYFRLWSAPVHRWLSKTIQRPMIEAGQREALRRRRRRTSREGTEPTEQNCQEREISSTNGNADGGGGSGGGSGAILTRWWAASVVCSFLVSGVVHEAVAFVAMRRTFWPFNTMFLCISASMTPIWDALFPVVAAAAGGVPAPSSAASRSSPSAAADQAVVATSRAAAPPPASPAGAAKARRRNGGAPSSNGGAPGSNGCARLGRQGRGASAAASTAHPRKLDAGDGRDVGRAEERRGQEGSAPPASSGRRQGAARPKMGSWRGWTPIVFCFVASVPITLALDYLVWQHWRHTFLVE